MDELEWEFANTEKCTDCQTDIPIKVCESGAGWYIGRECPKDGPYSRLSNYMGSEQVAKNLLAEWQDVQRQGGDLRYAHNVRMNTWRN